MSFPNRSHGVALAALVLASACVFADIEGVELRSGDVSTGSADVSMGSADVAHGADTESTADAGGTADIPADSPPNGDDCPEPSVSGCDVNATCSEDDGQITCECRAGFDGDGETCVDIDECADSTANRCDADATCTNEPGSYSCRCEDGFVGDGFDCEDVDECADAALNDCDPVNATCNNVPGGFECDCNPGFGGDGTTCSRLPLVRSVQTVSFSTNGNTSGSAPLPQSIDQESAVPFVSLRTAAADWASAMVTVSLNDTTVDWSRKDSSGDSVVTVAIVEFDRDEVSVQTSQFSGMPFSEDLSPSVDSSSAFATFTYQVDDFGDARDDAMCSVELTASGITIDRTGSGGSVDGSYWVAEARNGGFFVQHLAGTLSPPQTEVVLNVPTSVAAQRSFILYSHQTDESGPSAAAGQVSCALAGSGDQVTCTRAGSTMVSNLRVQVVELAQGSVQRGATTMSGTTVSAVGSFAAVDPARSHASCGQIGASGAAQSGETQDGALGTAFATCELSGASNVAIDRGTSADGTILVDWEVIEWE